MKRIPEIVAHPIRIVINHEPPSPEMSQYTCKNRIIANIVDTNAINIGANQYAQSDFDL